MKVFHILLILFSVNCVASQNKLILISLDGFRYDFLAKYKTPNLQKLFESGINATEGMIPSFPTNSLSNHRTLVTGLHPESHGFLDYRMYDPLLNETFSYNYDDGKWGSFDDDYKWWVGSQPIWYQAMDSGQETGILHWPGVKTYMETKYKEHRLFIDVQPGNQNFTMRVDDVIRFLGHEKLRFVALHFSGPADQALAFGPDSPQVAKAVTRLDNTIGYLVARLKEAKLFNQTNIIATSGRAMASVQLNEENALVISKHVAEEDLQFVPLPSNGSAMVGLWPKKGKEDKVFNALNNKHPNVTIYRKKDIPERFHFRNHRRTMPIVAIADEGYFISYRGSGNGNKTVVAMDGYDNALKDMRVLFLASGPNFKRGGQIGAFENVHVYPMMCHLIGIEPNPSNGSLTTFQSVLIGISVVTKPSFYLVIVLSLSSFYVAINSYII